MIEWRLTLEDVTRIRFAFSPLTELVLSLIVLRAPSRHALHLPWVRATRPLVSGLELGELFALVPVRGPTADFLTPTPSSPLPEFAEELELVRATPPERVVAELAEVPGLPAPTAVRIVADPVAALHRITDTLQAYWALALNDHWPRMRALLEADVLWRSRQLASGGTRALFENLHESISLHGDKVSATDPNDHSGAPHGEGILLIPNIMCWPDVRKMIEPYPAAIAYPARAIATLWETGAAPPPDALATLIGRTRATLLLAIEEPASTTALARRLALTPSAVSQHLTVLLDSGLATRTRVGRSVLYHRTRNAEALLTR